MVREEWLVNIKNKEIIINKNYEGLQNSAKRKGSKVIRMWKITYKKWKSVETMIGKLRKKELEEGIESLGEQGLLRIRKIESVRSDRKNFKD